MGMKLENQQTRLDTNRVGYIIYEIRASIPLVIGGIYFYFFLLNIFRITHSDGCRYKCGVLHGI